MRLPSIRLRAISPVIAMIIIVAITLSIAFAVVGWLFGIWGGLAGGTPQITITNVDGYIDKDKNIRVRVYVMNKGTAGDEILELRIAHKGEEVAGKCKVFYKPPGAEEETEITTINAGFSDWLTVKCERKGEVGDSFMLKFFFKNSGVITVSGVISRQVTGG